MKLKTDPKIVEPKTFQLLLQLLADPVFEDFLLVGGTALALQIGHRKSIDIDLFCQEPFDAFSMRTHLEDKYQTRITNFAANTVMGLIDGIKVDVLRHRSVQVEPPIIQNGVRMASMADIAAMKLNAISGSGERLKDFVDVFFMLEWMSFAQMVESYEVKYPSSNPIIPIRAVVYFDEIDFAKDPPVLVAPFDIEKMKKRLKSAVLNPKKQF